VTFNVEGIAETHCTCHDQETVCCKHQVALLLTYMHHSNVSQNISALSKQLADWSPTNLIALIEQMVDRHPDLIDLVESAGTKPVGQRIDVAPYQLQAQHALWSEDCEDIDEIVAELKPLLQSAHQFQQAEDWLNAGLIYQTLLAEINARYDHELFSMDYDSEIAELVQACVTGVGQCLHHVQDDAVRDDWLMLLLNCIFKELELGGVDYAYEAVDYLLSAANSEEWERLEALIRDEIPRSDRWEQETLIGILARRRELVETSYNS
jgi:uncharacterized Zn finger protein